MAKLATVVFVRDPERHRTVILHPGEEPAPHLAALITAPEAWENGELPDLPDPETGPEDNDPDEGENANGQTPGTEPTPEPEPSEPETEDTLLEEAPAKTPRKTTARKPAADQ
ncbi:hypothetical protein ACH4TP_37710 [Streptomyces sp. NPDC021012]|uniref:hypothetical protein n=1 Tax=Streptomyces sp. NPDC021012 TaxID=3365107 RepID=UPI00378EB6E9